MEPQPPSKNNGRYSTLASSTPLLSHHHVPLSGLFIQGARKTILLAFGSLLLQWPLYNSSLIKKLVEWSSLSLLKAKSMCRAWRHPLLEVAELCLQVTEMVYARSKCLPCAFQHFLTRKRSCLF